MVTVIKADFKSNDIRNKERKKNRKSKNEWWKKRLVYTVKTKIKERNKERTVKANAIERKKEIKTKNVWKKEKILNEKKERKGRNKLNNVGKTVKSSMKRKKNGHRNGRMKKKKGIK